MIIRVRLFAHMAQHAGTAGFTLDVPPGSSPALIQSLLHKKFPALPWPPSAMIAVNQQYVPLDRILHENDEVAIIPPVSGG